MESLNDLRRGGDDMTSRSLPLASRPPLSGIFEDHGQSLVSGSQQKKSSDGRGRSARKFKPAITTEKGKVGPSTRSLTQESACTTTRIASALDIELSDSQSEDEMDLLSSHRDTDNYRISQKRIAHTQDGHLDADGKFHPYLKGFEPKHLSALKFKKNKEAGKAKGKFSDTALSQPTQPTSSLPASLQAASPSKGGNTLSSSSRSKCKSSSSKGDTIYVNRPSAGRSQASLAKLGLREEHPSEPKHVAENLKIGPPSRTARIKRTNNPENGKRQPKGFSTSNGQISSFVALDDALLDVGDLRSRKGPSRSSEMSRSRSHSPRSSPKVAVRKPEAFPTLSPPSSPALPKRQNFPPLSPLSDSKSQAGCLLRNQKRRANPFPMLSPPSKGESVEVSRGRTLIKENGEASSLAPDDEDNATLTIMVSKNNYKGKERALLAYSAKEKTRRKLKMFPMSTDSSPTTVSPWGKRSSEGSGGERISKRSKKGRDAFPQSPTRALEEEGESSLFSPEVDPRSLCPYCDTPLPENPSSLLRDLIAATKKKASPDPRPSNPLGLKAPVAVFVTVCQRHRFESQILPEADEKGWPKTIEWNKVASRVMKMKNVLRTLIEDPGDESDTGDVGSTDAAEDDWEIGFSKTAKIQKQKGPKASSIFWNEIIQEIKEKGSRAVAGVRGQFANFEKAQPGYYGEQGSVIIHQTLYDMFPPSSMDASLIAPLTGNEFMEKILVPEVALRLIMEDKNLRGKEGKQEALTILRESSSYGVFMFPEDGGEWGERRRKVKDNQLGVGDMIVMQRAMKRRKELEEEGQEKVMQSEQEIGAKEPASTQPKPRPLRKASSAMKIGSSQDFPRTSQTTKQSPSDFKNTDVEISESDGGWRVTQGGGRRSPSAGETKRPRSSMHSTSRGISGLNLSSDTDTSSRAVVGARPVTRSRSRSVVRKAENRSSKMEVDRVHDDIKTPIPARCNAGLEDETPQAPRSQSRATPPLMRARRRHYTVSVGPSRQNYGTSKPPLPTRIHLNYPAQGSQDTHWLLEDESS